MWTVAMGVGYDFEQMGCFGLLDGKEFNKIRVTLLDCLGRNLYLLLCSEPGGQWTFTKYG